MTYLNLLFFIFYPLSSSSSLNHYPHSLSTNPEIRDNIPWELSLANLTEQGSPEMELAPEFM